MRIKSITPLKQLSNSSSSLYEIEVVCEEGEKCNLKRGDYIVQCDYDLSEVEKKDEELK